MALSGIKAFNELKPPTVNFTKFNTLNMRTYVEILVYPAPHVRVVVVKW